MGKRCKLFTSLLLLPILAFAMLAASCSSDDGGEDSLTFTRTITFNANDGSASPATTTQTFEGTNEEGHSSVTLKANTFTRSGYTFQGWSTSSTASTATYTDKETVQIYKDTTLYAVWKSDTYSYSYTITFNGNGGTTSSGAATSTQVAESNSKNQSVTLNSNPFTRSGYIFVGWAKSETSTTADYQDGGSITLLSSTTLYAVWTSSANSVTLTLDANNGSTSTKIIASASGQTVDLSSYASAFTSENATLTAFNTKSDGTGTSYSVASSASKKSITLSESTTLYAEWQENPKITFDGNGGSTSGGSTETYQYYIAGSYEYGGLSWSFVPDDTSASSAGSITVTLDENTFTRSGYSFKGWATTSGASTATYADKASVTISKSYGYWLDEKYYAVWKKTPTITYNLNGGDCFLKTDGYVYSWEDTFSETSTTITSITVESPYSYYSFAGWSSSSTAKSAGYTAGDEYTLSNDTTLYAVWKLGTVVNKSVSVAKNTTSTVQSFTLLKTESLTLSISNCDGKLYYTINNGTTDSYSSDAIDEATSKTISLSKGTYTLKAENKNYFNAHSATVKLAGN